MDKRYQIFVSSTYADLEEERQEVMQALLELDAIPAGMELFPAANEDQWSLIKRVIDDSDYYVVIIAGRYGSIGPDGISYTEMEYRYALETNKPIIGFIHKTPDTLQAKRCETTQEGKQKLQNFMELVKKKPCQMWESPADLGGKVSRSLIKLIKNHPATGWIRGNNAVSNDLLMEINELRKKNNILENQVNDFRKQLIPNIQNIASLDGNIFLRYKDKRSENRNYSSRERFEEKEICLKNIFTLISPTLVQTINTYSLKSRLESLLKEYWIKNNQIYDQYGRYITIELDNADFETFIVQLKALGLIHYKELSLTTGGTGVFCKLTELGEKRMIELKTIKDKDDSQS